MSAKHAVLALLADGPAHAYELGKRLQDRLGPAWEINSGQLSRTLDGLEEAGLVRAVDGTSGARRVVARTENGAAELDRWFGSGTARLRVPRLELLAKINLAGRERSAESLVHIDTFQAECREEIKALHESRNRVSLWGAPSADEVRTRSAITFEILVVEAYLQGAEHCRKELTWLKDDDSAWAPAGARTDAATVRAREQAREQLFRRMAESHLDPLPGAERVEQDK